MLHTENSFWRGIADVARGPGGVLNILSHGPMFRCTFNMPILAHKPSRRSTKGLSTKIWSTSIIRVLVVAVILTVCSKLVPESYFVCSKARNIYTVDQNIPRVECFSVRGSRIVGIGNFGACIIMLCLISYSKLIAVSQTTFKEFTTRELYLLSSPVRLQGFLYQFQESCIWMIMPLSSLVWQARTFVTAKLLLDHRTWTDAHAHIVENGYVIQMPLAGSKSIQGIVRSSSDHFLNTYNWIRDCWTRQGVSYCTSRCTTRQNSMDRRIGLGPDKVGRGWVSQGRKFPLMSICQNLHQVKLHL